MALIRNVRSVDKRNELYFQFQVTLVKDSVWQCRWVGAPLRQQRTLLFMMTTANQDLAITAGGFAPLSHHTMMAVRQRQTETPDGISDSHKQGPSGTACEFHSKSALTKKEAWCIYSVSLGYNYDNPLIKKRLIHSTSLLIQYSLLSGNSMA
jgi:hypothetical protein